MLAVTVRAYPAAIILLDTIHRVVAKVVTPPTIFEFPNTSIPEQECAIKNVMNAWRSSVAGTGSSPNSSKVTPETSTQPVPLFKNSSASNFELPQTWVPPQQSNDFSKGINSFSICSDFDDIIIVVEFIYIKLIFFLGFFTVPPPPPVQGYRPHLWYTDRGMNHLITDSEKEKVHRAKEVLSSMVYPPGSNPDYSPLHVLCCNDTCSFTWTGAEHINQVKCMFYV